MKARTVSLVIFLISLLPVSAFAGDGNAEDGGTATNTYIIFFGFTAQGIENIKQSPARVEAAKETVRAFGGEVKAFYGILGSDFDTIFIVEAPNDEAVSKMVLTIASSGNVRTQTHRLFTEQQYRRLISELP